MCYATQDQLIFSSGHDIFYSLWEWKKKSKKLFEMDTNHRDSYHPLFIQNTFMLSLLILSILTLIILLWMLLWLFYKCSHVSESMLYVFLSKIWFYPAWKSAVCAKSLNDKLLAFGSGKCLYSFWYTLDYSPHKVGTKQKTNHSVTKGQIHHITSPDIEEGTRDI